MRHQIDWQPVVIIVLFLLIQIAIMALMARNAVVISRTDARMERIEMWINMPAEKQQ